MKSLLIIPIFLFSCSLANAQDSSVKAFIGAHIIPIDGPEIPKGVLLIEGKKILSVGAVDTVKIPANAEKIDVSGKIIMPGLVDTHSHVGGPFAADSSAPIQPEVRVLDAVNVKNPGLRKALAGGITTLNVMSGSGHLMSGQTLYMKLRNGKTVNDFLIYDADHNFMYGMKMANGTNSQDKPPFPGTRAKSAALVRAEFIKANEYAKKIAKAKDDPDKEPDRDLRMEALLDLISGKRMVHHHTHRHDDIVTVLRLAKEFGLHVVLHHVSEAWKVAQEIAAAKVPCSIILVDSPGGKIEAMYLRWETGAILEQAGVLVAFHTDDPITDSRLFTRSAALAVRAGMSREKALYGLTMAGAIMLDLQDRVGSLTPGKDADFVIFSGDPLSVYTHVLQTWVEGEKVFDLENSQDRLLAYGGFGAGEDREYEHACAWDD